MSVPLLALGVAAMALASETPGRPKAAGRLTGKPGARPAAPPADIPAVPFFVPEKPTTLHPGSDKVEALPGGKYTLSYMVARLHKDRAFEIDAQLRVKMMGKLWACSSIKLRCRWLNGELEVLPVEVGGRCDVAIWQGGKRIDRGVPADTFAYEVLISEKGNAWLRVDGSNTMSLAQAGVIIDPPPKWFFELIGQTRPKPLADWPPE